MRSCSWALARPLSRHLYNSIRPATKSGTGSSQNAGKMSRGRRKGRAQTDISEERSHRRPSHGPHSSPAFRHRAAQHQRVQPRSAGDEEQTRLFTVEQQYNFVVQMDSVLTGLQKPLHTKRGTTQQQENAKMFASKLFTPAAKRI